MDDVVAMALSKSVLADPGRLHSANADETPAKLSRRKLKLVRQSRLRGWGGMKRQDSLTDEQRQDLEVLQLRDFLGGDKFKKTPHAAGGKRPLPEYFELGTMVGSETNLGPKRRRAQAGQVVDAFMKHGGGKKEVFSHLKDQAEVAEATARRRRELKRQSKAMSKRNKRMAQGL
eukprot:TRINITY_DN2930_c0_g1_i1.p2 TRINITY_DN2930_c0_g1~~TRINITY_DN2930_c0_g1_i1.p2  ORF type:complete len:174 (-),score=48.15 TRINITY_DN2930_c0_g1_i1:278-799(-)